MSRVARLRAGWPLQWALLGFPLWWALGVTGVVFLLAAGLMALQLVRKGVVRPPAGFGWWVLFLVWVVLGVATLWAQAPGTEPGGSPLRVLPFLFRVGWYLAVTVAMLYPLSFSARALPTERVGRWLGWLFVYGTVGGLAGVLLPQLEFRSLVELLLPVARQDGTFLNTMVHPAVSETSDFLGYQQARPKAPFAYPNAWGNNMGLLLPFFLVFWGRSPQRWQRWVTPVMLVLFVVPLIYSLNRGLWIGVGVAALYTAVTLARRGHSAALWSMAVATVLLGVLLVASPLWNTINARLDNPHSNERRQAVAVTVISATWNGSPVLGYGTTRKVSGNFASIAGTGTSQCRQCAAPPLGTQGFLWRLIFTTGFVGTALFMVFLGYQWLLHAAAKDAVSVLGCLTIVLSGVFFLVYDSLESPMFILGLAIGLMNRERLLRGTVPGEAP